MKLLEGVKIFGNRCIEFGILKFYSWKHSINIFDLSLNVQPKGDHAPALHFYFTLMNVNLIWLETYDTRHEDAK